MSKNNRKRSRAELKAIRRSYAKKADYVTDGTDIAVTIKDHHDSRGGHPHIIVDDIDDKHVSVGITHDNMKGKNHPNYAMESKPLGGTEPSYMRRQGTVAPKSSYKRPRQGKLTPKDYEKAKSIGDKAKKKYIEKGHKKR